MAITSASAVARCKSDPAEHLVHRLVHDACAAAGHAVSTARSSSSAVRQPAAGILTTP